MHTPTYEIVRIGDRYVPVLKDPYPGMDRAFFMGQGMLLVILGLTRRGLLGKTAFAVGVGALLRGATGVNPLTLPTSGCCGKSRDGAPGQTPSYQNDWGGRAPQSPVDLVEEQSMESFPASDPPGRTGASATA